MSRSLFLYATPGIPRRFLWKEYEMKLDTLITLTPDEARGLPFSLICQTRFGASWETSRRRRRWEAEFTEREREMAEISVFPSCRKWYLKGIPAEGVTFSLGMLPLWLKLAGFCASLVAITVDSKQ